MRFQVPQFTDVEDKVLGPLSWRQFLYLAGSGGLCVILFYLIPWPLLSFVLMVPVVMFGIALSFYKVNNRPFIRMVESFVTYFMTQKLYIWKHQPKKIDPRKPEKASTSDFLPSLGDSKLKDMTWSLDVKNIDKK